MRPQEAMAALAKGDATVIDVTDFIGAPQDLHDTPAVTEDYHRQVELG